MPTCCQDSTTEQPCARLRTYVYLNEPVALDLYRQQTFGDFSLGYLIGLAWAEAAQIALGSTRSGEDRQLVNDCLAGAWVRSVIPVNRELPQPRDERRTSVVSPGDLDEAIRTAIIIGDSAAMTTMSSAARSKRSTLSATASSAASTPAELDAVEVATSSVQKGVE